MCIISSIPLRVYPQGFADFIRELHPRLVVGAEGTPQVDPNESPQKMFDNMDFSTWQEARLIPCLRYLRGNKYLQIPKEWEDVFPRPFEILNKLGL